MSLPPFPPFTFTPSRTGHDHDVPVVFDSPHSGVRYPKDFDTIVPSLTLRRAEDTHVEKIYAFAPALGVAWVEAHFPRIYLDANRDTLELDTTLLDAPWPDAVATDPAVLNKVRLGKGLGPVALETIRVPTLTISARDDGFGTYVGAEYTASRIPRARFIGYEHGGHLLVGHDEARAASCLDNMLSKRAVETKDMLSRTRPR